MITKVGGRVSNTGECHPFPQLIERVESKKTTHVDPKSSSLEIYGDLVRQAFTRRDRTLSRADRSIVIVGPVEEIPVGMKRGADVP